MSSRPTLRIEGVLAADTPSLRDALSWPPPPTARRRAAAFQRFALKAQTNVVGRNIALSKVNLELDGNAGEGVLTYVADGRRTLQGTLAVERLNLTPYMSAFRLLNAERGWSRMPLELDALGGIDVDLRISAARVTLDGFNLGQTAVAANLRAGNLTLAIGESQAFGGVIKGSLALAKSTAGADLQAQLQFTRGDARPDARRLLRRAPDRRPRRYRHRGRGQRRQHLRSRQGAERHRDDGEPQGRDRRVQCRAVAQAARAQSAGGARLRLPRRPTPYDELAVNLKVTDGTAHAQDVRIETPAMRVGLAGSSSIAARDFDLKGTASLTRRRRAATPFQLPFVVMGTWDDPLFWPDIQMLIRRSGAAAPLLDAVRNRLNREAAPTLAGEAAAVPAAAAAAAAPVSPDNRAFPAADNAPANGFGLTLAACAAGSLGGAVADGRVRQVRGWSTDFVQTLVKLTIASLIVGTVMTHFGVTPEQLDAARSA